MSYKICQDFEYAGNDYWRWWAWVDASDEQLDQVEQVTWVLHPTFKRSRITSTERATKFELRTAGWGTFQLKAEIKTKNEGTLNIKRNLRLEYPPETGSAEQAAAKSPVTSAKPLTVYLSFGMEDSRAAETVRESLTHAGITVLDQTQIAAGAVFSESVKQMLRNADAILSLVGEGDMSPWVRSELENAVACEKPAFALVPPGSASVGILQQVKTFEVNATEWSASSISALRSIGKIDEA